MRCGKAPPVIHDRSLITICPWCAGDLRIADPALAKVGGETFDYWAASELGACIAYASAWQHALAWEPVSALKAICSHRGVSTAAALARAIGTSKLTTWYWLTGKARPCLGSVLRVYYRFGLSLAEHLFKGALVDSNGADGQQHELNLRNARHARQIDWQEIKERMLAELHVPIRDAPTFIAVAGRLGIARRTLRANQPKLCLQLAKRYRRRRKTEKAARARTLATQIKRVLRKFAERDAVPQWRVVEKALRRPGLFNSHYARRVLRQCLRELAGD
jgi:transcriptional regulator with XRE-family HTH domain